MGEAMGGDSLSLATSSPVFTHTVRDGEGSDEEELDLSEERGVSTVFTRRSHVETHVQPFKCDFQGILGTDSSRQTAPCCTAQNREV